MGWMTRVQFLAGQGVFSFLSCPDRLWVQLNVLYARCQGLFPRSKVAWVWRCHLNSICCKYKKYVELSFTVCLYGMVHKHRDNLLLCRNCMLLQYGEPLWENMVVFRLFFSGCFCNLFLGTLTDSCMKNAWFVLRRRRVHISQTWERRQSLPHLGHSSSSFDLKILVFTHSFVPIGMRGYIVTYSSVVGTRREDENVNRLEVFLDSLIEIVVDVPVK